MPRAPKYCGYQGSCTTLVQPPAIRCSEHTGWKTSPRTASADVTGNRHWREQVRPSILERDGHRCQIRFEGVCTGVATVVDKIIPAAKRLDLALDPANLRAACEQCNDLKARTLDQGKPLTCGNADGAGEVGQDRVRSHD